MTKFKILDIRPLIAKGDEPFSTIRNQIDRLRPGEGLSVLAPFLPSPLIEMLTGEGFRARVEHHKSGWITHFWRDDQSGAG